MVERSFKFARVPGTLDLGIAAEPGDTIYGAESKLCGRTHVDRTYGTSADPRGVKYVGFDSYQYHEKRVSLRNRWPSCLGPREACGFPGVVSAGLCVAPVLLHCALAAPKREEQRGYPFLPPFCAGFPRWNILDAAKNGVVGDLR